MNKNGKNVQKKKINPGFSFYFILLQKSIYLVSMVARYKGVGKAGVNLETAFHGTKQHANDYVFKRNE